MPASTIRKKMPTTIRNRQRAAAGEGGSVATSGGRT
jgi:hypothetical protein